MHLQDPQATALPSLYAAMDEPELLTVARDYDSLTDAAQSALRAEFAHRKLDPPMVEEKRHADLLTIRRYRDLSEAIVARTVLEASGIEVFLQDENLVRLDWQVSNFIGGIRLQVDKDDEAAATALLDETPANFSTSDDDSDDAETDDPGSEFIQPLCPVCGSAEITFEGHARSAALASLYVLGLPVPTGKETWLCDACGHRWENAPDQPAAPEK